jgi:hypothetical protein
MIEIEKGIPRPKHTYHGRPSKYPWAKMEIGDSFSVPPGLGLYFGRQASAAGKRWEMKFSVRRCEDGSYRVWRDE